MKTFLGSITGAILGSTTIPFTMIYDLCAPLTYPVAYSTLATSWSVVEKNGPLEHLAMAVGGGMVGALAIPLAPLNFISRPVIMPIIGAGVGAVVSNTLIK